MSAFIRFLVVLALLILTNVGTYLFARWQCGQELEGQEELLAQASARTLEVQARLDEAEEELDRLQVWGDFITIQQDLNRVNDHINQLNFGNALDGVDEILAKLESGAYGSTFREHRSRLLPLLTDAKQALRNRSDRARTHLVEFNEAAFTILAGIGPMEGRTGAVQGEPFGFDEPTQTPATPPEIEPQPPAVPPDEGADPDAVEDEETGEDPDEG